jgi:hypothetical protein
MTLTSRDLAIIRLYEAMPWAPAPPVDDEGYKLWGMVSDSANWRFCEAIVDLIDAPDWGDCK